MNSSLNKDSTSDRRLELVLLLLSVLVAAPQGFCQLLYGALLLPSLRRETQRQHSQQEHSKQEQAVNDHGSGAGHRRIALAHSDSRRMGEEVVKLDQNHYILRLSTLTQVLQFG